MPGPSKTPRGVKLLRNTLQPCRDSLPATPALPPIDGAPSAPAWLTDITAVSEFRRLAAVLTATKLLTAGNVSLLAHFVMLHARITAAWQAGETPSAALMAVYRRLAGDLGLTHMPLAAPPSAPNRFHDLARRRR